MEVCNIVSEAVSKTIPKRKKSKKAKWLSEEALQIAEKKGKNKPKLMQSFREEQGEIREPSYVNNAKK